LSISSPPSHCPRCGRAIRWYHNLPVTGWIALGGKCYHCRASISPRYPLVELVTGLLFVVLGRLDVYGPAVDTVSGAAPDSAFYMALVEFAGHAWIASTLLAASLIRWDGVRPPLPLIFPAIGICLLLAGFGMSERRWWLVGATAVLVATLITRPIRDP
jgi:leader peptidase (prepilin peptidase) / N-methyltransferase